MKIGLQIYSFSWPGGPEAIGPTLARAVRTADDVGFDSIWVMDHFWQIGYPGSELQPMLEGWTTLGFMAAHSQRAQLGLLVGGVHYRNPGLWVKAATTLDVLSGGRAWLGIGAAWNQAESEGLGFPFPPLGERFEMLEDTLEIAQRMWQGERGTEEEFQGHHFHAGRLLNVPAVDLPTEGPDHDRRRWRAKDAPARRQVCRRLEHVRGRARPPTQVRDPRRALRGHRPRLHRDRANEPAGRRAVGAEPADRLSRFAR